MTEDTIHNSRLNKLFLWISERFNNKQLILILSFFVGIFTGFAAQSLKWIIEEIEFLLTHSFDVTKVNWLYLLYPVIGIFLTALFIKYIVRDNIGHGITKILYSISRRQGHIKRHNTWTSIIASGITIGFGGSVGAESPIVLTGSAIGSYMGSLFKLDHKTLMLLIGCGASGAIAGIFKAPVAGLVFSLEVLMLDLTMASLLPLLVSCLTAAGVTYAFSGTDSIFTFHVDTAFDMNRIPYVIFLGVICGLISLYFTRAMNAFENVFRKYSNLYVKLLIGGSVLSVLIFLFPPLYGEGYNTINQILNSSDMQGWEQILNNSLLYGHSEYLIIYLILIILTKVFATSATNGGGGCGGTFAPALFLGCIGGFTFSRIWNTYAPVYLPEKNYALLGMAGVMSGIMHAPLTGIFLIAETTAGYSLLMPLMIVSVCSYLTIISVEPHSIYAMRLARKGQLITHHTDHSVLTLMSVDAVIDKQCPRISPNMSLGTFVLKVSKDRANVFAVINNANQLLGVIDLNNIRKIMFRQELYHRYTASQIMQQPKAILRTTDPMTTVMDKFEETGAEELPILNNEDHFIGFISKTRLYSAYRKILIDFSEE